MYETDFLQAVAEQNFKKYNIHVKKTNEVEVSFLLNSLCSPHPTPFKNIINRYFYMNELLSEFYCLYFYFRKE